MFKILVRIEVPAQIRSSDFQPGGGKLLGIFINKNAGSNPLKRFSAGAGQLLGIFINRNAGSNQLKQFSAGGH